MKLLSKLWRRASSWGEHLFRRRFFDTLNLTCNAKQVVNSKTHLFLNYPEHSKIRKTLHDKIIKININHYKAKMNLRLPIFWRLKIWHKYECLSTKLDNWMYSAKEKVQHAFNFQISIVFVLYFSCRNFAYLIL